MSAYDTLILATSGLVSFWPLNETSGGTATDAASGGNSGLYQNTPTLNVTGIGDGEGAVSFNGSTQYVQVPTPAANLTGLADGPLSLEVWFKQAITGQTDGAFMGWSAAGPFEINLTSNELQLAKNGVSAIASSTSTITDTTTWHYAVVTKNGSAVHLYLDGVDVTGAVTNATLTAGTGDAFQIATQLNNSHYFSGALAKAAIYNVVLTPAQVASHANWSSGGGALPTAFPVFLPRKLGPAAGIEWLQGLPPVATPTSPAPPMPSRVVF